MGKKKQTIESNVSGMSDAEFTQSLTGGEGDLPSAGHKRDEILKQRMDRLEEQAQELVDKGEIGAINPKALEVDDEIAYMIKNKRVHEISGKQKGYRYAWTWTGQSGHMISVKQAMGWEVIHGDMPEAKGHRDVNGYARIADTIAMRCREEVALAWDRKFAEMNSRREGNDIPEELAHLARKKGQGKLRVHSDLAMINNLRGSGTGTKMALMDKEAVQAEARKIFHEMLAQGKVPGVAVAQ